jgi:hypothetical protein
MIDPVALLAAVGFLALGLGVIPLDQRLETRRRERRRYMARPRRR